MLISSYLDSIFNKKSLKKLLKIMEDVLIEEEFSRIAFRGTSGCAVAFPLALAMDKQLIHVRKPNGHSKDNIEGWLDKSDYVIVDDLVDSGDTLRTIKREIEAYSYKNYKGFIPKCKAIFLYDTCHMNFEFISAIYPESTVYGLGIIYENGKQIYELSVFKPGYTELQKINLGEV